MLRGISGAVQENTQRYVLGLPSIPNSRPYGAYVEGAAVYAPKHETRPADKTDVWLINASRPELAVNHAVRSSTYIA